MARLAISADQAAREHWGPMLARQNLRPEDIASMDEEQVVRQLAWVDDAAANPDRFGTIAYAVVDGGANDIAATDIRPALYDCKARLLNRREQLRGEELKRQTDSPATEMTYAQIKSIAAQWAEFFEDQRQASQKLQEDQDSWQRDMARAASARTDAVLKSQLRRSWWSRESVASIVGAGLLGLFGLCIAIGMWTNSKAPDLMGNAFLLVLGYFFGQSAERRSEQPKKDGEG